MNTTATLAPLRPSRPSRKTAQPLRAERAIRERIQKGLKTRQMFILLAETFQAMGDTSRIQIVWSLSHGELSVTDLVELTGMSQPSVSHHLRTLRNLKLVKARRDGRAIFYSLDDEHIENLLIEGIKHVEDLMK